MEGHGWPHDMRLTSLWSAEVAPPTATNVATRACCQLLEETLYEMRSAENQRVCSVVTSNMNLASSGALRSILQTNVAIPLHGACSLW